MLKIQSDRVIIDGHEPTKEQCETMTLLANALAKSDNFETVEYRDGYAEFEKVGKAEELKFKPSATELTIIFDSNITSVSCIDSLGIDFVWSSSGETLAIGSGGYITFTVLCKEGYELSSVMKDGSEVIISNNTFTVLLTDSIATITLTSKQSTPRVSVDLTTLAGWEALAAKSYDIQIVAKANGYRDSEPSAAVQVEKAAEAYTDCLTFTGENGQNFTLKATYKEWDGVLEYSTDHNTWTTLSDAGVEMSSVNGKLYLRGSGNTRFYTSNGVQFVLSERAGCSGNMQTLLDYENPPTSIPSDNCYYSMFNGCTGLTTAPELPATTLKTYCYSKMFRGCTGLTTAPKLPATTLVSNCYYSMFSGCTGLTTAPELPATTLAVYCYYYMFSGCTSLKVSSTKTGEYQKEWRIPTSGTIASEETFWSAGMLDNTGGTFTSNPSINTTYYVENEPV